MTTVSGMSPPATAPSVWGARSLDVARVAAIVGAVAIPVSTALVSAACGVLLLALILSGQAHRVLSRAFAQPLGLAIVVFFLVVAAGMLHGPADWPERLGSLWSWRKPMYAFLLLGLFGDEAWKRRFVWTLALASLAGVLASFAALAGWIPSKANHEIGVLFQNHTTQGLVFSVGIVCCVQVASATRGAWRGVMIAAVILMVLNILFVSPGRSAYLVLAAIPIVLGVQRFGWRRIPALIAIVAVLGVAAYAFSSMVRERVDLAWQEVTTHETSESLTSVGFRVVVYRNTAALIAAHPIVGYGTGSFRAVYTDHVRGRYTDWRGEGTADPHNQYLLIAMETGVIGLLAFGAIIVAAFRTARARSVWAWVGVTVLVGWLLTSLFSSHFRTFAEGHLVAFVLGAMLARDVRSADARDES